MKGQVRKEKRAILHDNLPSPVGTCIDAVASSEIIMLESRERWEQRKKSASCFTLGSLDASLSSTSSYVWLWNRWKPNSHTLVSLLYPQPIETSSFTFGRRHELAAFPSAVERQRQKESLFLLLFSFFSTRFLLILTNSSNKRNTLSFDPRNWIRWRRQLY